VSIILKNSIIVLVGIGTHDFVNGLTLGFFIFIRIDLIKIIRIFLLDLTCTYTDDS